MATLEIQLRPMTRSALEEQAATWFDYLQAKEAEITASELQRKALPEDATAQREEMMNAESRLGEEKAQIVRGTQAVIDAWKAKGGDPEEIQQYLDVVNASTLTLEDPTDVSGMWITIRNWATSAEGGIKWAVNIGWFVVILVGFRILSSILAKLTEKTLARFKGTSDILRNFMTNTVRKVVFFVGFVIGLGVLGVPTGPFLAAMGAAGFVIGFALQGTLSNFASGVMILLYRPYDVGDVVNVAGVAGSVQAMTLVSTSIKTFDNQVVVVPNNSIWGDVITNVTGSPTRRVDMKFGCGYEDDLDKAQQILEEIVQGHDKVLKDPAPVVRLHELADSSVNFVVRPWANTSDYWDVTKAVKARWDAAKISIPFPQRDVHMHQAT